jgi:hypothetical protein
MPPLDYPSLGNRSRCNDMKAIDNSLGLSINFNSSTQADAVSQQPARSQSRLSPRRRQRQQSYAPPLSLWSPVLTIPVSPSFCPRNAEVILRSFLGYAIRCKPCIARLATAGRASRNGASGEAGRAISRNVGWEPHDRKRFGANTFCDARPPEARKKSLRYIAPTLREADLLVRREQPHPRRWRAGRWGT